MMGSMLPTKWCSPVLQAVPKWFTAGGLPGLEEDTAAEMQGETTSSDDELMPEAHPQHDFDITEGKTLQTHYHFWRLPAVHMCLC